MSDGFVFSVGLAAIFCTAVNHLQTNHVQFNKDVVDYNNVSMDKLSFKGSNRNSTETGNEKEKEKERSKNVAGEGRQRVAIATSIESGNDGLRKNAQESGNVRSRLVISSRYSVGSKESLVGAGYASLTLGLFTVFRISPFLMFVLAYRFRKVSPVLNFDKIVCYSIMFSWWGTVLFVLIVFGSVLTASARVTKRWALMLHPIGLTVLYLDMFVWVSLNIWLHLNWSKYPDLRAHMFDRLDYPLVYFIVIYVESVIMGVLYYVYATYFIAVETLIIETDF